MDDARASDPNAQSDLKLHAECPDEGLDITANQPVRDQATRGFLPPSPTQDRILDVEPVEEPVDRKDLCLLLSHSPRNQARLGGMSLPFALRRRRAMVGL